VDDSFFTAYFPGSVTVCGRRLDRFTSHHYLLLRALDSPFMAASGTIDSAALLVAVSACRKSFGDEPRLRPTLKDAFWRLRMMRSPKLFERECKKFAAWMAAQASGPKFWEVISGGQKTRDLTGPDILTLVTSLMMKTSISESEAWDMPLGRAKWLNAEINELEGSERRFLYQGELMEEEAADA